MMTKEEEKMVRDCEIARLRKNWNVPPRHLARHDQITLGEDQLKTFNLLLEKSKTGFLYALVSGRGVGKTQVAAELMFAVTEKLRSAFYMTATEFYQRIKNSYKESEKSELEGMRHLQSKDLLVIDEMSRRGQTEWENNLMFELINSRYNGVKDTLLIDNSSKTDFWQHTDPSITSRMAETGGIIECAWPNFRQ